MVQKTEIVKATKALQQTIYFMKGIPGSGKSTWARGLVEEYEFHNEQTELHRHPEDDPEPYRYVARLNKDDFRSMVGSPDFFDADHEKGILAMQRAAGIEMLDKGWDIIIDDTNIAKKHLNFWKQEAEKRDINMIEVFMDVAVDECIARDAARENPVGADVIKSMYTQLTGTRHHKIDPRIENLYEPDVYLPGAVICDLDGTACLLNGRSPFSADVSNDVPNYAVLDLLKLYEDNDYEIIFFSGREGSKQCIDSTRKWFDDKTLIKSRNMYFRAEGDNRKDSVIKREMYDKYVKDKYAVQFVLDDRDQVVDLWRKELNLPCFQVYYGDF